MFGVTLRIEVGILDLLLRGKRRLFSITLGRETAVQKAVFHRPDLAAPPSLSVRPVALFQSPRLDKLFLISCPR